MSILISMVRMGRRDTRISRVLVQTVSCSSGFVKAPQTAEPHTLALWPRAGISCRHRSGATDNGAPSARLYYDPRYYAANVFDPDGYSIEFVYKSWQHSKKDRDTSLYSPQ
jgi:hypothetical protein